LFESKKSKRERKTSTRRKDDNAERKHAPRVDPGPFEKEKSGPTTGLPSLRREELDSTYKALWSPLTPILNFSLQGKERESEFSKRLWNKSLYPQPDRSSKNGGGDIIYLTKKLIIMKKGMERERLPESEGFFVKRGVSLWTFEMQEPALEGNGTLSIGLVNFLRGRIGKEGSAKRRDKSFVFRQEKER